MTTDEQGAKIAKAPDPIDQLLDDTAKVMLSDPFGQTWHEALRKAARGWKIERIEQ